MEERGHSWSRNNRYLASSSLDWNVIIWDLAKGAGERKRTLRFDTPVLSVRFCPTDSRILVVTLESQQAFIIDLRRRKGRTKSQVNGTNGSSQSLPVNDEVDEARMELRLDADQAEAGHPSSSTSSSSIISAIFSPDGTKVFAGTSKGDILIFDKDSGKVSDRSREEYRRYKINLLMTLASLSSASPQNGGIWGLGGERARL